MSVEDTCSTYKRIQLIKRLGDVIDEPSTGSVVSTACLVRFPFV